jgi:hypothetical protein
MSDYFLPLKRSRKKRDSDLIHKILSDWYGKSTADNEIISRLPKTEHIGDGIHEALKQLLPPHIAVLQKIKGSWEDIAGKQLARYMTPSGMRDTTLFIEVSHPAWLMEFREKEQLLLLRKIQGVVGDNKCKKIKLTPAGRDQRYVRRKK